MKRNAIVVLGIAVGMLGIGSAFAEARHLGQVTRKAWTSGTGGPAVWWAQTASKRSAKQPAIA